MATPALDASDAAGSLPAFPRRHRRRYWSQVMLFAAVALLVNGLFGERGLTETRHAGKAFAAAEQDLARLRRENAALRDQIRRLRSDSAAIEAIARGELGFIRPGEILVTVKQGQ